MDGEEKCRLLEAWLDQQGVTWAADAVSFVAHGVVGGMGVRSKRQIRPGEIGGSTVSRPRNTAAAKVIEQEGLDLDASLRLSIATEVALGSRSRWHGYFMSFTRPFEDLPYLWSPEQRRQLAGTDAEGTVEETLAELQAEYEEVIQPLLPRLPLNGATISRENYLQAATLATSRAFTVDDYHLEALVPLADAFNHRCQKVPAGEVVREIQEGEGAAAPPLQLTGGDAVPFAPWLGPVPPMQIALAESRMVPEGAKPKRHVGRKTDTGRSGQLMIYVLTEIPADTEIFNTYGEFSNDKLLQDYGFVLEQNAFNTVTLARSMLAPGRRFRRHLRLATQHAALLGLTQAGSGEEESEEGSEDAEMGRSSSQEQGLATFFELDRGPLPKALRVLLAVLSLPTSTLVRARAAPTAVLRRYLRRSSRWVLQLPVARCALRAALRRRSSASPEPTEAAELRRRWEAAEAPQEKAALALRRFAGTEYTRGTSPRSGPTAPSCEPQAAHADLNAAREREEIDAKGSQLLAHPLDLMMLNQGLTFKALVPQQVGLEEFQKMWFLSQTCKKIVEIKDGDVKTYDGDFRYYMDMNQDVRTKIESHYTGIDGLIDSVPATLAEKKKKDWQMKQDTAAREPLESAEEPVGQVEAGAASADAGKFPFQKDLRQG
eukprot:s2478_g3.t2